MLRDDYLNIFSIRSSVTEIVILFRFIIGRYNQRPYLPTLKINISIDLLKINQQL